MPPGCPRCCPTAELETMMMLALVVAACAATPAPSPAPCGAGAYYDDRGRGSCVRARREGREASSTRPERTLRECAETMAIDRFFGARPSRAGLCPGIGTPRCAARDFARA